MSEPWLLRDLEAAEAERDRYKRALETIRELEGKVCDEYEVCTHRACQSSYGAWSIADGALGSTDPIDPLDPLGLFDAVSHASRKERPDA
jgi:hypothetical protein